MDLHRPQILDIARGHASLFLGRIRLIDFPESHDEAFGPERLTGIPRGHPSLRDHLGRNRSPVFGPSQPDVDGRRLELAEFTDAIDLGVSGGENPLDVVLSPALREIDDEVVRAEAKRVTRDLDVSPKAGLTELGILAIFGEVEVDPALPNDLQTRHGGVVRLSHRGDRGFGHRPGSRASGGQHGLPGQIDAELRGVDGGPRRRAPQVIEGHLTRTDEASLPGRADQEESSTVEGELRTPDEQRMNLITDEIDSVLGQPVGQDRSLAGRPLRCIGQRDAAPFGAFHDDLGVVGVLKPSEQIRGRCHDQPTGIVNQDLGALDGRGGGLVGRRRRRERLCEIGGHVSREGPRG